MSNQTADCCEQCGATTDSTSVALATSREPDAPETDAGARWLDERPALDGSLPSDLARLASEFYGVGDVETLGDYATATRAAADGNIEVADLCHADGETPHRATTNGETYHFQCFYDGVVLARLRSEPVSIRTESPGGSVVELEVAADGSVTDAPSAAAMSFGIAPEAVTGDGEPTPEEVYGAVCPYVKAFPSREAYEGWAAATDAATVGLPLTAGLPVATALVPEQ
jgi:alkylmercury lyase